LTLDLIWLYRRWKRDDWDRNFIVQSLMRTLAVVVGFDLFEDVHQVTTAHDDELVQGFSCLSNPSFSERVAVGRTWWSSYRLDTVLLQSELDFPL
jgi:hypothetical protein